MFVEDEKRTFDPLIFADVVPRVDGKNAGYCSISFFPDAELGSISFPVKAVTLLGCGDDIDIQVIVVLEVVGEGCDRFATTDASPQYGAVVQILYCLCLVGFEINCHLDFYARLSLSPTNRSTRD